MNVTVFNYVPFCVVVCRLSFMRLCFICVYHVHLQFLVIFSAFILFICLLSYCFSSVTIFMSSFCLFALWFCSLFLFFFCFFWGLASRFNKGWMNGWILSLRLQHTKWNEPKHPNFLGIRVVDPECDCENIYCLIKCIS